MLSQFFGGVRDPGSIRCRLRDEDELALRGDFFPRFGVAGEGVFASSLLLTLGVSLLF